MHFKMSSAIRFTLDQSKLFSSGNGLNEAVKPIVKNTNVASSNISNRSFGGNYISVLNGLILIYTVREKVNKVLLYLSTCNVKYT